MSLVDVKSFYKRLSEDETFRAGLQTVKNKEECSQFVKKAGYDFTQEEFEDYTSKLLESSENGSQFQEALEELDDKELASVFGGFKVPSVAIYGLSHKFF